MAENAKRKKYPIIVAAALSGSVVIGLFAFATVYFIAPCLLPDSQLNADCYCRGGTVEVSSENPLRLKAGAKANCIKLSEAQYPDADLNGVDLEGADIADGNFQNSNLVAANLRNVNMTGTNFSDADLRVIDASIADFSDADFSNADLSGAKFIGAKLVGARLDAARLVETDFSGGNLSNADMERVVAKYANFSYANLSGAVLTGGSFRFTNFSFADLRDVDLAAADFYGAQISGAIFDNTFAYDQNSLLRAWAWSDRLPQGLLDHARITICHASFRPGYEAEGRRGVPRAGCATGAPSGGNENAISRNRRPKGAKNFWENFFGQGGGSGRPIRGQGQWGNGVK